MHGSKSDRSINLNSSDELKPVKVRGRASNHQHHLAGAAGFASMFEETLPERGGARTTGGPGLGRA